MKASGVGAVDGRGGLDESGVPHAERFSTAADDDDLRREGEALLFGGGAGATRVFLLPGLRPNDFGGGVETSSMFTSTRCSGWTALHRGINCFRCMGVVAGVLEFGPRVGFVSVQQRK